MGYEYYLFATYVFLLVCVVLLICKKLFSDTKRQKRAFDDMEKKLLRTYETVEEAIDEFYDLAQESKAEMEKKHSEIKDLISDFPPSSPSTPVENEPVAAPVAALPKPKARKSTAKQRAISEPDNHPVFEQLVSEKVGNFDTPVSPLFENVQSLAAQGKSRAEIAKELKITQNVVGLVLGLSKIKEVK